MLKPADGIEGVKNAILTAVKDAGPNACPPMVVGVGIGGTFEKCAILAKKALTRNLEEPSEIPYVRELEKEMLRKDQQSWNRTGWTGRNNNRFGCQHQYLSDTYCRTAGSRKYLLSCKPSYCSYYVEMN